MLKQYRLEINIPQDLNENLDQETTPQLEGVVDPKDEMPLGRLFCPHVHRMPPPIGPTLVALSNVRRNAAIRPPRHQMGIWNNCIVYPRTRQFNIPHPRLANNGAMTHTE